MSLHAAAMCCIRKEHSALNALWVQAFVFQVSGYVFHGPRYVFCVSCSVFRVSGQVFRVCLAVMGAGDAPRRSRELSLLEQVLDLNSKPRGNNLKIMQDFQHEAKAKIRP